MKSQHTSGEWEIRPTGATSEIHKAGERSYYIATVGVGISDANTKANACLIAAAPDLLAACEFALRDLENLGDFCGMAQFKLRNVITKATASTCSAELVNSG